MKHVGTGLWKVVVFHLNLPAATMDSQAQLRWAESLPRIAGGRSARPRREGRKTQRSKRALKALRKPKKSHRTSQPCPAHQSPAGLVQTAPTTRYYHRNKRPGRPTIFVRHRHETSHSRGGEGRQSAKADQETAWNSNYDHSNQSCYCMGVSLPKTHLAGRIAQSLKHISACEQTGRPSSGIKSHSAR